MECADHIGPLSLAAQASSTLSLLMCLWLNPFSQKSKQKLAGKDSTKTVSELALVLALPHLAARDLANVSCACRVLDEAASHDVLWKVLWRRRYGCILQRMPDLLRNVDSGDEKIQHPMAALRLCLRDLRMPPCWWVSEPPRSYLDQVVSFEQRLGPQKQWKSFYFAFGMHWPKWAVAEHKHQRDCWLVIHGVVFDMTNFDFHPGRREPFMKYAGLDATDAFEAMRHSWSEKMGEFGAALIVRELQLPREGSILRPSWLLRQEAVPAWKDFLFRLVFFDVHRKLSYHDFW